MEQDLGNTSPASGVRPVLLAWAFVAVLTSAPYLRAALAPPPGQSFLGFFFQIEDIHNYLSYVQQAEDGAFFFTNKLVLEKHSPTLVNLEWWAVGRLSAVLERRPALAYRIVGMAFALALILGTDLWLRHAGLPDTHRLPALLLVLTGAGLGGMRFVLLGPPAWRSLDLITGLYPFIEILINPHFVVGTALLVWGLLAFFCPWGRTGSLLGILLGSVLGLCRPYDLVTLGAIRAAGVFLTEPPRAWVRALLPLTAFLPVAAYDFWVFHRNPAFALFQHAPTFPPLGDFAMALGPSAALAALWWKRRAPGGLRRRAQVHLLAWAVFGLIMMSVRPVSYSLQFLVGLGLPLLALASLGLGRFRPALTLAVAACFSTTAVVALRIVWSNNPRWFVPAERREAALALRGSCRPGDLVLAPPDIGIYAIALSACKAYLSHGIMTDFDLRDEEARTFYGEAEPVWRSALLDRRCLTHVVLPGDPGHSPRSWLGEGTPFVQVARVGRGVAVLSVYARRHPLPCGSGPP